MWLDRWWILSKVIGVCLKWIDGLSQVCHCNHELAIQNCLMIWTCKAQVIDPSWLDKVSKDWNWFTRTFQVDIYLGSTMPHKKRREGTLQNASRKSIIQQEFFFLAMRSENLSFFFHIPWGLCKGLCSLLSSPVFCEPQKQGRVVASFSWGPFSELLVLNLFWFVVTLIP